MTRNKKIGLLALPILAGGLIGVLAVNTHPASAAPAPTNQAQVQDTPEPGDKADAREPSDANEPKNGPDTDNVQDNVQN
jgi:hypothetical protein